MQLHLFDPYATLDTTIVGNSVRHRGQPAFTAHEMRHHFAIEALTKPGFGPQPYLYTCIRCRWIFRINDSRGSVIALDGFGRRLPIAESARRSASFHQGPCPAFPVSKYDVVPPRREHPVLAYVSRFVDALRSLADASRRRSRSLSTR